MLRPTLVQVGFPADDRRATLANRDYGADLIRGAVNLPNQIVGPLYGLVDGLSHLQIVFRRIIPILPIRFPFDK